MHPMLNIAIRAARAAGNVVARSFENVDKIEVEAKGSNDLVTNVDLKAEEVIIETLRKSYPEHSIVSEECGQLPGKDSDYQWIVDPINGTENFVRGIPHFAISIALKVKGKIDQAVIYDPIRGELFTASRGKGAQFNNLRVRVKAHKELAGTVIATGFPHKQKQHTDAYFAMAKNVFTKASDLQRTGCSALDLAYVAAGRVDGFFEIGLKPWDSAAGELLVIEAGGLVTDFVGGHNHIQSGNVVAASPRLLKALLTEIRPNLTTQLKK